jgi:hypothetical protein
MESFDNRFTSQVDFNVDYCLSYCPLPLTIGIRRDRMGDGFTTTCAISAYHHLNCELTIIHKTLHIQPKD